MVHGLYPPRRQQLTDVLKGTDIVPMSVTTFARIGCPEFTTPVHDPIGDNAVSQSIFFPDSAIWSGHPRYKWANKIRLCQVD